MFLHVCGKRDDNKHLLDSLIVFTDFGDKLTFEAADRFAFKVTGPFAKGLKGKDLDSSSQSLNLVVRAVYKLARALNQSIDFSITLEKNLPIAAGIGGGSADAAACIRGLCQWWDISSSDDILHDLMLELGADVPVCFKSQAAQVQGIGDIVKPLYNLPSVPILLVNPNKKCSTWDVFYNYSGPKRNPCQVPSLLVERDDLIRFLKGKVNDLYDNAVKIVPDIPQVMDVLESQQDILHCGMSGSGATCYGLFKSESAAKHAAERIKNYSPNWWAQAGRINHEH